MSLEVILGKLRLKNPVILASGTFDKSIAQKIDLNKIGGLVTKTITIRPRQGNHLPHIIKTKYGWLNSVGLKNPGLKKYLKEELPFWQKCDTHIFTSIGGESEKEYVDLARLLNGKTSSIEINVSCPNIAAKTFDADALRLKKLILKIRKNFQGFIVVKLSPNVADIILSAKSAVEGGADALTIANTYLGLELVKSKPIFQRIFAGYSGGAIKPLTMRLVWQVSQVLQTPIIGSGGVESAQDVLDYISCGAKAVQIGSANFLNPEISVNIINGLQRKKCH